MLGSTSMLRSITFLGGLKQMTTYDDEEEAGGNPFGGFSPDAESKV